MKKITSISFFCFFLMYTAFGQGVVAQQADASGYYARLGITGGIAARTLNLGSSRIETWSTFFPPPTLTINQNGGNVTIGDTDAETAKLTVRANNESQIDLRLEGEGIVSTQGSFYFYVDDNNNAQEYFSVKSGGTGKDLFWIGEDGFNFMNGHLAIGEPVAVKHATDYRLSVDGRIISEEVRVELTSNWPDYVFKEDYSLMSLADLKSEIKRIGHLPGMPSAKEVESEGFDLGNMNRLLLEKIEELTLHVIDLQEQINALHHEE